MSLTKKLSGVILIVESLIFIFILASLNFDLGTVNYGLAPDQALNAYYFIMWVMFSASCLISYFLSRKLVNKSGWVIFLILTIFLGILSWCFLHYYLIDKLFFLLG
ncbi:MAG: hypothetical protein NTV48_00610 [Candidatus Vogelbacteria bacterium]|nr:hypothetical protein [Candidatus Vogelbacteria bacterium]